MKIYSIILILMFTSCSTPYQKRDWKALTGGYLDTKKGDNTFNIDFIGNGYTTLDKAKDYTLL